jgi:hypothetical protein
MRQRTALWPLVTLGIALAAPLLAQGPSAEAPSRTWLGPDGKPLPFRGDAEILEFLRTARVVSRELIPQGINKPDRVVLEKDGITARAAFRHADIERKGAQVGERFFLRFRDSCHHECAAYRLAVGLGLDNVPPVVPRRLEGRSGSLQLWVEGGRDVVGFKPRKLGAWITQVWDKDLFDNLILNVDRNTGNMVVGEGERLWLIDHTRAFQPVPELLDPGQLRRINRGVWSRLREMGEAELRELVKGLLDGGQAASLARRRELLIEHAERLVAERGEDAVFY